HERTIARKELFQALVTYSLEASGGIRASVRIFNNLTKELTIVNYAGDGWTADYLAVVQRPDQVSAGYHAVKLRRPFLIDDVDADPTHYRKVFPDAKSNFALPILLRGEVAGLLTLQSRERGVFTPERRYVIQSMVRQCVEVLDRLADIQDSWL